MSRDQMSRDLLTLPWRVVAFAAWFGLQILRSSWAVLSDVATPGLRTRPRVVRMRLASQADWHVATIGALITLTPGTLTLGVVQDDRSRGGRALLVHSMYHDDPAAALEELSDMERRMLHALRLHPGGEAA